MEGNSTVAATATGSSTSIVGENAAPMQAASPTQMNTGSIENYLISVNQGQQGSNPNGTPGGLDEAIAGKPLDQQIDIINKWSNVMDNTNHTPDFMDAGAIQRDINMQQQQAPQVQQQQQQEQQQQQKAESDLAARITALENARMEQSIEAQLQQASQDPNNWEEISYDEWQEHWNEFQGYQNENTNLKAQNAEYYKNNLALSGENDILKSTIGSLQGELKDTKSKLAYLESTANIVNDAQETKLLNLRRAAAENQGGAAELNYLNLLQQERHRLTGQDLSQNINDLYFNRVQSQAKPVASDYETYQPTTNNQAPQISNLRDGDETKKNLGSIEDFFI